MVLFVSRKLYGKLEYITSECLLKNILGLIFVQVQFQMAPMKYVQGLQDKQRLVSSRSLLVEFYYFCGRKIFQLILVIANFKKNFFNISICVYLIINCIRYCMQNTLKNVLGRTKINQIHFLTFMYVNSNDVVKEHSAKLHQNR